LSQIIYIKKDVFETFPEYSSMDLISRYRARDAYLLALFRICNNISSCFLKCATH